MSRLRAAIVGAGLMGRWHAHYAKIAGADVVAIVDRDGSAAAALQRRWTTAGAFTEIADCLGRCPADVFHICTPVETHGAAAETVLRAGKSVLLEKPVASSLRETQHLVDLAKSKNVPLIPVHQLPFQRGFRWLRRRQADLGDLVRVAFQVFSAGGVRRTAAGCRALLLEILPHPLSLFFALFGQRLIRCSWSITRFTSMDLNVVGHVDDTLLEIMLSLRGRPTRNELTVVGTKATGRVDFYHGYAFLEPGRVSRVSKALLPFRSGIWLLTAAGANLAYRTLKGDFAYPGLRELISSFHQSVRTGSAAPISEEEILETARCIDRISFAGSGDAPLHDPALSTQTRLRF